MTRTIRDSLMATIAEALAAAIEHHQAGNLAEAERIYREILEVDPGHVDAWHLLGLMAHQLGKHEIAIEYVGRALSIAGRHAEFHCTLALAHAALGKTPEADACLQRAVGLDPHCAQAHNLLGNLRRNQGRLAEAIACYRRAIEANPGFAEAQNNLGIAWAEQGNPQEAAACFLRATAILPGFADAYSNLGEVFRAQGKLPEAMSCYRRALELKGDLDGAWHGLGAVYAARGEADAAIASYRRALEWRPDFAEAHHSLGAAHAMRGGAEAAIASYRRALELKPDFAEAHNSLGAAYAMRGDAEAAIASYRRALELKPDFAEAHNNLGAAHALRRDLDAAVASYGRALALRPDYAEAHSNLANALREQGRLDESIACCRRALELKPELSDAHVNLGSACFQQGNLDAAAACYQRAIQIEPQLAQAHWNLCLVWLLQGDFARGWPEYDWQWRVKDLATPREFSQPWWDGHPLRGREKMGTGTSPDALSAAECLPSSEPVPSFSQALREQTILLYADQGLGDTIQFIRYAKLVQQQGMKVVVECQQSLVPLLNTCQGIDQLVPQGVALPRFDVHCPLARLPQVFQTNLESIPRDVPYLRADAALVEVWRKRLARFEGFRVGITWQGNPRFRKDRLRSVPLVEFAPLAEVAGVSLISVQKGYGAEQLAALIGRFPVSEAGEFDEYSAMDRAAVLMNLDLMITSDTAMAHLAGALGVPVWVALPLVPDWRWLLDREDSPWYPTMRLFRQKSPGDWGGVFRRMKEALAERVHGSRGGV